MEIYAEQRVEAEKQRQLKLEAQANIHYDQAIQSIDKKQLQDALQEMQQAHRLYLSEVQPTKKADRIFRHLSNLTVPPKSPATAKEIIELIDQLPTNEVSELGRWFDRQYPPDQPSEVLPRADSTVPLTGSDIGSALMFQPLNPQETAPELVLRKLHDVIEKSHERIAARICQSAEEYAQEGKNRRSRTEYRKLGELYRESAESFIESENWHSGADCYARAQLAYIDARRYNRARHCAQEAGTYYAMQADSLERHQNWVEAGRLYALSADHYAHASLWKEAEESLSRTTICYFNVAENARAAGDLSLSYNYCDRILTISKRMKGASNAVTGARKLLQEIEGLFTTV